MKNKKDKNYKSLLSERLDTFIGSLKYKTIDDKCGFRNGRISDIIGGGNPRYDTLRRIIIKLKMNADWLLGTEPPHGTSSKDGIVQVFDPEKGRVVAQANPESIINLRDPVVFGKASLKGEEPLRTETEKQSNKTIGVVEIVGEGIGSIPPDSRIIVDRADLPEEGDPVIIADEKSTCLRRYEKETVGEGAKVYRIIAVLL